MIRRRLSGVPKPLAMLLVVVGLFGVAWALLTPAWQSPDEDAHFGYVQAIGERGELPGKGAESSASTEQRLSMDYTNTDAVVFFAYAKPEWGPDSERAWQAASEGADRSDGGGSRNAAAAYPPAYYLYETLPYELTSSADVLTRLYAMRLASLLWLLVTTIGAWLLAGELFGKRRALQLVTAAATGLWPMLGFISVSVNPDAMLVALWTLSLWLGTAILRRGLTPARALGLCACVGLAMVTKATAFALLPAAGFALLAGAWRARRRIAARRAAFGVALITLLLPVGAWYGVAGATDRGAYSQAGDIAASGSAGGSGGVDVRELASYLWQFYLPRLPFQRDFTFTFPVISDYPAYQVWLGGGWANFGWANIWFPGWVYLVFLAITIAALVGLLVTAFRGRRARGADAALRTRLMLAGFFALAVLALLAGLHWTDYTMLVQDRPPFMQGRYLLPLSALFAAALAQSTRALPPRARPAAWAALLAGLVVFQLACLGLVATRFYA